MGNKLCSPGFDRPPFDYEDKDADNFIGIFDYSTDEEQHYETERNTQAAFIEGNSALAHYNSRFTTFLEYLWIIRTQLSESEIAAFATITRTYADLNRTDPSMSRRHEIRELMRTRDLLLEELLYSLPQLNAEFKFLRRQAL